jgi:HSP20 family protein
MTNIARFDPFRDLQTLKERMDRLFDDTLSRRGGGDEILQGRWAPAVDIFEDDESIVLEAELPGMSKKDIRVNVNQGVLTLEGERKFSKETKEENYHRIERAYGSFMRSFTLPSTVDTEKIQAEHRDGVLTVRLPKKPEAKPKSVEVKVG